MEKFIRVGVRGIDRGTPLGQWSQLENPHQWLYLSLAIGFIPSHFLWDKGVTYFWKQINVLFNHIHVGIEGGSTKIVDNYSESRIQTMPN